MQKIQSSRAVDRQPGYMSVKEASARFGVTPQTIRCWIRRLDIQTTRAPGGRITWIIKESDLQNRPARPKKFKPRQVDPVPGFMTRQEAAAKFGVSTDIIKNWIRRLGLRTMLAPRGHVTLINESDLSEAVKKWKGTPRLPRVRRDPTSVSPNEAAKVLNVTGEAVKQWIYCGDLKATKLPNGYWRIKHEDLKAYLETRQNVVPMVYVATCDPILAERILGVAGKLGNKAGSVTSTSDALKQFDQSPPKLLLVDLGNFPDGWKLIRKVRGTSYYGSPKILLVGMEPLGEKETGDALRLGINGCLVGEVSDTVLEAEMKGLLGRGG